MITLICIGLFLVLAALGAPLFLTIVLLTLINLIFIGAGGFESISELIDASFPVVLEMFRITESPVLIAIPFFTLAGAVMTHGGISRRLIDVARAMVGWMPGGLGIATILACAIFTALSGSSAVTIIAIGGIIMPALLSDKYSEKFSLGLITSVGAIGILIPPSLPLIIYGFISTTEVNGRTIYADVNHLFIAGLLPTLVTIGLLAAYSIMKGAKFNTQRQTFSRGGLIKALKEGIFALMLPIILLGGIYGGVATAAEISAIAVIYAIIVEVFIHKEVKIRELYTITVDTMVLVGSIIMIIFVAMGFTYFLTDEEIPLLATDWIKQYIQSPLGFLVALNILLLIVGCLMDIFSAILVVGPLVVPIAAGYGIDLVHLGVIFVLNLNIGFTTPPFGINLFISSSYFKKPVTEVFGASFPFLIILLIGLGLVTYFPGLSLWLVPKDDTSAINSSEMFDLDEPD